MNKVKLLLAAALALTCAGCSAEPGQSENTAPELHNYNNLSLDAGFDTVFTYQEATETKDIFDAHFQQAVSLFTYYNNLFDIYNSYEGMNNMYTINENAGVQTVKVDPDLIEMLIEARDYYERSGGKFDITIGSLLKVWHEYRDAGIEINLTGEQAPLPELPELEEASSRKGWEYVEINEEENTVFITNPDVSLDVGGIAKGFATEKIAQKLNELGITNGAVNAGGNTRTLGQKYNGQEWRIGIQNPDAEGSLIIVKQNGACSFVTSGDYERYFVGTDGVKYHHIIDPDTMYPASYFRSVSIITPDSAAADALSTTLFTMSYEDGMKLVEDYRNTYNVSLEVIWIMSPDKAPDTEHCRKAGNLMVAYTPGLEDSLIWNN